MRLDVTHVLRPQTSSLQRRLHHPLLRRTIRRRETVAATVLVDRTAPNHRQNRITGRLRITETVQYDQATPVRTHVAVGVGGKCLAATIRREHPELLDASLERDVRAMIDEAVECEAMFADDLLGQGVGGLRATDVRQYIEHCADQRLARLGMAPQYGSTNPLAFMELQDVQELTNFFERRPSAYQVAVEGTVELDVAF